MLGEMGLAVLPARSTEVLPDGLRQSAVVVTGHQVHFLQSSFLQAQKELIPGCLALPISDGETEHLPYPLVVHTDSNQEAFGDDPVLLPGFHVDGIHHQERSVLRERTIPRRRPRGDPIARRAQRRLIWRSWCHIAFR